MKLYTVFTESHREFFEKYFIKTLPFDPRIELRVLFKPQIGNGEFLTKGWLETMKYKTECFVQAIEETPENEYFIFADPDIQFFRPFVDDMLYAVKDYDVVFQHDYKGGANTGFFIMKRTPATRGFIHTVNYNVHNYIHEQECINAYLADMQKLPEDIRIRCQILPRRYWTYGEITKDVKDEDLPNSSWTEDKPDFDIPKDIVMHHANWTRTVKDKFKLLDLVRKKYNEN